MQILKISNLLSEVRLNNVKLTSILLRENILAIPARVLRIFFSTKPNPTALKNDAHLIRAKLIPGFSYFYLVLDLSDPR